MLGVKSVQKSITVACVVGVVVSLYALRVEMKKEEEEDYEAMCDISEHMSCTRVLSSRWGRGFGIVGAIFGEDSSLNQPNSISGIIFYILIAILNQSDSHQRTKLLFRLSIMSNIMSLYLAYLLYFVLHDFCIVCVTTYVVNALLLGLSCRKLKFSGEKSVKKAN